MLARDSFGWEAGIRTPIGGSRVRSLTVRRPPNRKSNLRNWPHQVNFVRYRTQFVYSFNNEKLVALLARAPQNVSAASLRVQPQSSRSMITTHANRIMNDTQTARPDDFAHLRAAVAEHEKKLTEAAELVAHVRHEINNPLAALLGQAQLLLREDLSEKSRRRAETIEAQAKRIQEIVAELRVIQAPSPASTNT